MDRTEERSHQGVGIKLAAKVEFLTGLKVVPNSVQGSNIFFHSRGGLRPAFAVALVICGFI
ncbi:MAG: hypothetical protein Ct9H300mP26_0850 [Acidimicrobiales bacterium]|nr:MAG: hypothetical protein Ct9H300mP26_0850 [Acidimicrobiales bacterium]